MDFPIATRIPSFENIFWNYLSDSIITVDVNHRQPTQAIFSHCCSTPSPEATKSRERPLTYPCTYKQNRLITLEGALKSHEHLGTSQSAS